MNRLMKREKLYTFISVGIVFLWAALPVAGQTCGIAMNIPAPVPRFGGTEEAKPCVVTVADIFLLTDSDLTGDDYDSPGCLSSVFQNNASFLSPLSISSIPSGNNKTLSSATQFPRPPPSL